MNIKFVKQIADKEENLPLIAVSHSHDDEDGNEKNNSSNSNNSNSNNKEADLLGLEMANISDNVKYVV
jgi:hypothetical protein